MPLDSLPKLLERVADHARRASVFGEVQFRGKTLVCDAANSAAPAEYRLSHEDGKLWVSLATKDRWLSQSIEADLVHTGDSLAELIDEELVDLGVPNPGATFEHFRSEDLHFTFRTAVPLAGSGGDEAARLAANYLLAYEACFRQLGDMDAGDEDEG